MQHAAVATVERYGQVLMGFMDSHLFLLKRYELTEQLQLVGVSIHANITNPKRT